MNSLTHGFFFLAGLSWLLSEVCIDAGAGFWTPLWLFLAGFVVMFAIMGCLPVSEKAINTAGPVFTLIIAAGIAFYGVEAFGGSALGAILRLFGAAVIAVMGVISLLGREKAAAH